MNQSNAKGLFFRLLVGQVGPGRQAARQVVHLHRRRALQLPQLLEHRHPQVVDVRSAVPVLHHFHREVDLLVVRIFRVVGVVLRNRVVDLHAQGDPRLVGPAAGHILDRVAASADHDRGQSEFQHVVEAPGVALHAEVELAQLVVAETVCAQLHHEGVRPKFGQYSCHYVPKQLEETVVADARLQRHIQSEILAFSLAFLVRPARAGKEVLSVLVEGDRHAAVRKVEGFLNAVPVMDVDVQIEHSWVDLQQLQNGENDVVDVAKATCLRLLCMVKSPSPVYGHISLPVQQQSGGVNGGSGGYLAEIVEAVESGAVGGLAHFEVLPVLEERECLVGRRRVGEPINPHSGELVGDVLADELLQVEQIVLGVETSHFLSACLPRVVDVQLGVKSRVHHQRVCHRNAFRLHGMFLRVNEFAEVWVVEVRNFTLALKVHQRLIAYYNKPIKAMLIEIDKYQPNSLRRGRVQALEKDISDGFTIFSNRFSDPKIVTMNDFISFWQQSQLKYIIYIRNEDEDEDEYFQAIDKILINDYFVKGSDSKKIYCLLCLYFFTFTVDVIGDRNPRFIHVTVDFINALYNFLRMHAEYSKYLYIKVIKKIRELFIYSIKLGPRDPLIKKNGDTFIRYPKQVKKLTRDNYSPAILEIKDFLPGLDETIKCYQESKDKYFKQYKSEHLGSFKRQMNFDKNITMRLNQILKSYDAEMTYVEEDLRNMAEEEPIEE